MRELKNPVRAESRIQITEPLIQEALQPSQMALKAQEIGIGKASTAALKTFSLAILAGSFIAFGAVFSTVVISGSGMDFGLSSLLGGLAFSLGLILVVVGGAELFTGNNLMIMTWANRKIRTRQVLSNWGIVYTGNLVGSLALVVLIFLSGHYLTGNGVIGEKMLLIANAKCSLGFLEALTRGILCNILVCLAIWLCLSAKSVHGKIISIIFPITAFVAAGFEHSVANMYFIPVGLLVKARGSEEFLSGIGSLDLEALNTMNFLSGNLLPVTLGNIIGGAFFVGLGYWFIYLRRDA